MNTILVMSPEVNASLRPLRPSGARSIPTDAIMHNTNVESTEHFQITLQRQKASDSGDEAQVIGDSEHSDSPPKRELTSTN